MIDTLLATKKGWNYIIDDTLWWYTLACDGVYGASRTVNLGQVIAEAREVVRQQLPSGVSFSSGRSHCRLEERNGSAAMALSLDDRLLVTVAGKGLQGNAKREFSLVPGPRFRLLPLSTVFITVWNNTQFDRKYFITIECARKVGEFMNLLGEHEHPQILYSFCK